MTAFGYIRLSVIHDESRRDVLPDAQETAIRQLAALHGDDDVVILSDLDRSGKLDRRRRPGWDQVLTAIEGGEAHAVYAYSLSRFARSRLQLEQFAALAESRGVRFATAKESIDTSTAMGKAMFGMIGTMAAFESDVASERIKDAFAAKRASDPAWRLPGNWAYGSRPGEDVAAVLAAFDEAQSFDAAARLLNERGVPTRGKRRNAVWHGSTVRGILRRADPDRFGEAGTRGIAAGAGAFRLSRLLACGQCGTVMTPSADSRTKEVRYYCRRARVTPHGRGWVSEKVVLPAIAAEAERAAHIVRLLTVGSPDDEAKARALEAKRARLLDMAADGMLGKAEAQRRLAEVAEAERGLTARRVIRRVTVPALILDAVDDDGQVVSADGPQRVNEYLRRLLDRVVVESMTEPARRGPSRVPVRLVFEWTDPALRADAA